MWRTSARRGFRFLSENRHLRASGGTQDCSLGYFQPCLAGLILTLISTQDCVLGHFQPSLWDCDWKVLRQIRPLVV